ncbi:hypothetical protein ACJX0J_023378 [Zea mays]
MDPHHCVSMAEIHYPLTDLFNILDASSHEYYGIKFSFITLAEILCLCFMYDWVVLKAATAPYTCSHLRTICYTTFNMLAEALIAKKNEGYMKNNYIYHILGIVAGFHMSTTFFFNLPHDIQLNSKLYFLYNKLGPIFANSLPTKGKNECQIQNQLLSESITAILQTFILDKE